MALYKPLDTTRDEIRVISISGIQKDSEGLLQCTMETVSLSDRITEHQELRHRSDDGSRPSTSAITDSAVSGQSPALGTDAQPRFSWGEYETLSYAWGSPSDPSHDILVNGQRYRVRQNLYHVLSQFGTSLRYASRVRLWVDAICINQDDGLERAIQVKRMKQIYSTAMRTIVWLGKDLGPTYSAVINTATYVDQLSSILKRIIGLKLTVCSSTEGTESTTSSMGEEMVGFELSEDGRSISAEHEETSESESSEDERLISAEHDDTSESESIEDGCSLPSSLQEVINHGLELVARDQERLLEQLGLSRGFYDVPFVESDSTHRDHIYLVLILLPIIHNEYWRRVWIIQELSASTSGSLILIGSSAFALDELLGAAWDLTSSVMNMVGMIPYLYASQPHYINIYNFMSLMRSVSGLAAEHDNWNWRLQGIISKSTLAADKFYGTAGLMNSDELSEMIIDYDWPVSQVSIDATRAMMKETKCLCQFVICTSVENPTIPSWALDLSQEYDRFTSVDHGMHLVVKGTELDPESSTMDRPPPSFSARVVDDRILIIRGSILDEVDGLGSYPEDLLPPMTPGRTRKRIAPMSNPTTETPAYRDALGMLKALDRALLSVRPKSNRSVFHMPMLAVTEDELYKPASYPEGMKYHTAAKLLALKHFCERNADFNLWGVKFGSLFPGLKEEERERVSASQKLAYQALSSLQPSYHKAWDNWNDGGLSRRRLISTIGGYLGLAAPFAARGDKICAIEGCHSLVLLRPVDEYFEFVGLLGIKDLKEEAKQCRERGFDREMMLR
ncbi:hypothetical protein CEP54_011422 [Fusarium duplospermum]|uniref:Heterokaryon incompatibility domain-containing protein n=1 Tax=Fusarium duplospermum TaxID=1325734 RepID=A0A428PEI9_9HYPO|nr:hypothetical protein CEP54_011422 [Fusarium duplospermum]